MGGAGGEEKERREGEKSNRVSDAFNERKKKRSKEIFAQKRRSQSSPNLSSYVTYESKNAQRAKNFTITKIKTC